MSNPGTKTIMHVIGARPNVMKLAPLYHELRTRSGIRQIVVHSGQHYDPPLMAELFEDFGLPMPGHNLGIGELSPGVQYGEIILRLTRLLEGTRPDLIVTYGDVRTTPAAAIAGFHAGVPCAHYEGGLRAHCRIWAEEFHRITADAYSEIVLAIEPAAVENAVAERKSEDGVHLVGDLMCDAARLMLERAPAAGLLAKHGLKPPFAVFTAHHTNNVDLATALARTLDVVEAVAARLPVVYPMHPRTRQRAREFGLEKRLGAMRNLRVLPPLRYADFIPLVSAASVVVSDSGSLCPECVFMAKPMCLLHPVTERQLPVESGAVVLTDMDAVRVAAEVERALNGSFEIHTSEVFDGHAAQRTADVLERFLQSRPCK